MSSTKYTMKLIVDDSAIKKLEDRLGKIMGSSGGSGGGGGSADSPMKNLMKLGAIAAGIALIVVMIKKITEKIVEASPALQAMLKILDASVTLILRPFGDFIAYLLRPMLIIFLTKVALPFYKMVQPIMALLGSGIGDFLAGGMSAGASILGGIATGDWEAIENGLNWFKGIWLNFVAWISDALSFPDWMQEALNSLWGLFINIGFAKEVTGLVMDFFDFITTLSVPEFVFTLLDDFIGWFSNLDVAEWGAWVVGMIYGFVDWFKDLKIAEWVIETIFAFTDWFKEFKIAEWVMGMVNAFTEWFKNIEIEDWMNLFVAGFFGFIGILGIATSLIDPFMAFVNFIYWIAEQIAKVGKWFSDALSNIGLGSIFGGDTGGGSSASSGGKTGTINVRIDGETGTASSDDKAKILELMKEVMK